MELYTYRVKKNNTLLSSPDDPLFLASNNSLDMISTDVAIFPPHTFLRNIKYDDKLILLSNYSNNNIFNRCTSDFNWNVVMKYIILYDTVQLRRNWLLAIFALSFILLLIQLH